MFSLSLTLTSYKIKTLSRTLRTVTRVSVLEHAEYADLKKRFALKKKSSFGPLDTVCNYLLASDLKVNQTILHLNAIGFSSVQGGGGIYSVGVNELKNSGKLVTGHLNVKCDQIILEQFQLLVSKTRIDEAALQAELLKAVRSRVEREFMLKRQLVGFFLLQGLAQLDRFLKRNTPVFEAIMIQRFQAA